MPDSIQKDRIQNNNIINPNPEAVSQAGTNATQQNLSQTGYINTQSQNLGMGLPVQDEINVEKTYENVAHQPYAKSIFNEIKLLAEDKNKASEFFEPVVRYARILTHEQVDEMSKAYAMAQLLMSIRYYLNNRPASRLSSQRNRRRSTCERLLGKSSAFINEAPVIYSRALKSAVQPTADNPPVSKEARDISESFGYYMTDEYIDSKDALRKLYRKNNTDQIPEISRILDVSEGVDSILRTTMPERPGKKSSQKQLRQYEKNIFDSSMAIKRTYDIFIESCDTYLKDKNADATYKELVQVLRSSYEHVRKVFSNKITEYLKGHVPDESATWFDALSSASGRIVHLDAKGVQEIGRGTSRVYKVKDGERNLYYKEEEKISMGPIDAWETILSKAKNIEGYDPSFESDLEKLNNAMNEEFALLKAAMEKNDDEEISFQLNHLYEALVKPFQQSDAEHIIHALRTNRRARYAIKAFELISYCDARSAYGKFVQILFNDFVKQFNQCIMARYTALIPKGSVLSLRNVATTRMADVMGIGNLVARAESVDVMMGNKKLTGTVMEEAKGTEAFELYRKKNDATFTDDGVMDMITMQVFDFICGQIDRNNNNYFLTRTDSNKLCDPKMIDNDLSFGLIKPDQLSDGYQSMPLLTFDLLKALPANVKTRIHEMAAYPKEHFTLILGDLLGKKEINSMMKRLTYINNALTLAEKQLDDMKKKNDENAFIADMINDKSFAALYYQKAIYDIAYNTRMANDPYFKEDDEEEKMDKISETMTKLSYISFRKMPKPQVMKQRFAEYKRKANKKK